MSSMPRPSEQGEQYDQKGDVMNDPEEYSHVDDWITTIILVLIIITVIGVVTGFVWGML